MKFKNITFSLEKELIEKAREKANKEKTSLNAVFRNWLKQYTECENKIEDYDYIMEDLNYVCAGRKFTRDEMNEW
jgi:hypothetical protein